MNFLLPFLFSSLLLWQSPQKVNLVFVGDLMQHQGQIEAAHIQGDNYDYSPCFFYVQSLIEQADIAIGNLEVTLGGKPYHGYPMFSAPDEYLTAIKNAGFDVLLTANNHCLDRSKKGLERTIKILDEASISHLGTYKNTANRSKTYPLILQKKGIRIALLNYTYATNGMKVKSPNVVNYLDTLQMKEDICKARKLRPDVIIACLHWGIEYQLIPNKKQRKLARWLFSQGVDHIIGGHPHVIQPIEVIPDKFHPTNHLVAYSLGNFISNMVTKDTGGGLLLRMQLTKQCGVTRLTDANYELVWTSRPSKSGLKNFRILPARMSSDSLTIRDDKLRSVFLKRARDIFERYNKGIKEIR